MRLFIAINLNETTRTALVSLQNELRATTVHGRFSAPENLHLTLAFLGECDPAQTAAAKAAIDAVGVSPFPLVVDRVGRFKRDGGNIVWAGVARSEPLLALQRGLTERLQAVGFELETRKYSPHITLAREVAFIGADVHISLPHEKTALPFGETVTRVDLMKSEHTRGKLTYTAIYSTYG